MAAGFTVEEAPGARGFRGEAIASCSPRPPRSCSIRPFLSRRRFSLDPPAPAEPTGYGTLSVRPGGRSAARGPPRDPRAPAGSLPGSSRAPRSPRGTGGGAEPGPGPKGSSACSTTGSCAGGAAFSRSPTPGAGSASRFPLPTPKVSKRSSVPRPRSSIRPQQAKGAGTPEPTLAVYHGSAAAVTRLRPSCRPRRPRRPPSGGLDRGGPVGSEDGFERTLVEGGALLRRERITLLPDGIAVEAEGPLALFRIRTWRLEQRPAGRASGSWRLCATRSRRAVFPKGLAAVSSSSSRASCSRWTRAPRKAEPAARPGPVKAGLKREAGAEGFGGTGRGPAGPRSPPDGRPGPEGPRSPRDHQKSSSSPSSRSRIRGSESAATSAAAPGASAVSCGRGAPGRRPGTSASPGEALPASGAWRRRRFRTSSPGRNTRRRSPSGRPGRVPRPRGPRWGRCRSRSTEE